MTAGAPLDIVIPYYGDVGLMQQAVRSVLAQDTDGWQLTVVDDCMPGHEIQRWLGDLAHPRVSYLRNAANLGINANFRRAVEVASSEHLVVLGADDLLLPHYVSTMRAALTAHPEVAVVQPGVGVVDEHGRPTRRLVDTVKSAARPAGAARTVLAGEPLVTSLLRGNWTYFPSLCWRREAVLRTDFRPGLQVALDLALLVDLAMAGESLLLDPTTAFLYRRHAASYSSRLAVNGDRFAEEKTYFRTIARECEDRGWHRAARAGRGHLTSRLHAASLAPRALRGRDLHTGARLLGHALGG